MNIAPLVLRAVQIYTMSGSLKKEDYQFSVEARGHTWDVYQVHANKTRGQLAFFMEDGLVHIGWFGPGERTKEEMQRLLATGVLWEIPDA